MKNKIGMLLASLLLLSLPLILAQESSPQLPHLFYGTSKIDGGDTPVGTTIIAKVGGVEKGRITTTEVGKYGGASGSENKLIVQGDIDDDATIEFYIATVKADQTGSFDSGKIESKALTWDFPPVVEINTTEITNLTFVVTPDNPMEINLPGLSLDITSDTAVAGTIENISASGTTFGVFSGGSNVSSIYEVKITGNVTIIVTMSYDDTGIDESTIVPYKFVGGVWTAIPFISRDTVANTITFEITAETPYTVFGSAPTTTTTTTPPTLGGVATTTTTTIAPAITTTLPATTTTVPAVIPTPAIPTGLVAAITGFATAVLQNPAAIGGIAFVLVLAIGLFVIRRWRKPKKKKKGKGKKRKKRR